MPRLFIAAELTQAARDKLSEICCGLPGADWVDPDKFHLTLRFIGEVEEARFHSIRESLHGVQAKSFWLTLKSVGHFPLRGDPEILWAGAERNDALIGLRNKIESLLTRQGIEPDARKFHPHVTLAKVKGVRADWSGQYIASQSLFSVREIPVQSFALFSSRLKPEGSVYTLEASYPLHGLLEAE